MTTPHPDPIALAWFNLHGEHLDDTPARPFADCPEPDRDEYVDSGEVGARERRYEQWMADVWGAGVSRR